MRVLVAEDEPVVREALGLALRTEGYEVTLASDGVEAFELFGETAPDAALLDLLMPRLDGIETCRRIREAGSTAPIILITAVDGPAERAAAQAAGVDEYVVKPFEFAEVLGRLRSLLAKRGAAAPVPLQVGDMTIDPTSGQASTAAASVSLSAMELRILTTLLGAPERTMPAESLVRTVWGYDFGGGSRLLDPYLRTLNTKLARLGDGFSVEANGASRTLDRRPSDDPRPGSLSAMATEFTSRSGNERGTVA